MSNKNPWEAHGHPFQAPTGPVQMFDPSKFQPGAAYGVPETQSHDFDHGGAYQNAAEEVQPHFVNPLWSSQQQEYQGLYESSHGNVGHLGYADSEYGWSPSAGNPESDAASDLSHQYQGNFDGWQQQQQPPQQDYYYPHPQGCFEESSGNFGGKHQLNYDGQELDDGFNQVQNYSENDSLPVAPFAGVHYPSGDSMERLSVGQSESSYEAGLFCGSSDEMQSSANFQASDGQMLNQQRLDSSAESEQHVPASNSFVKLPHHPSPFDEISGFVGEDVEGERSDRLSLPASASHSRQSSCSGARFILGSSEHISGLGSKNISPPLFGKVDRSEEELSLNHPSSKSAIDQHVDCGVTTSGSTPRDHPLPCLPVDEPMLFPPSPAAGPGTMTGIPARNQLRKVPETKPCFTPDAVPGHAHIPTEAAATSSRDEPGNPFPTVQCTGSGTASTEGASGAPPSADYVNHLGGASHFPDGSSDPVTADPCVSQSAETGHDHQMNVYAMPITAHPGSSFVPVGPRSSSAFDGKNWPHPLHEAGIDHIAMGPMDLGNFAPRESHGQPYFGNVGQIPEQHKDVLKSGFLSDDLDFQSRPSSFPPHPSQKQRPRYDHEVFKGERPALKDYSEIPTQLHSVLPKLHRDKTMSPAATLWENPDPLAGVEICLVPAAAIKEVVPGYHVPAEPSKNALGSGGSQPVQPVPGFDLPQNTGTGPGKNTANVVPTHSGTDQGASFGFGSKGPDGQVAAMGLYPSPQTANKQTRDHDITQQNDALLGDITEGVSVGAQGAATISAIDASQYTVAPVDVETAPRIVAHVRNESIDSLTEEFTKFGGSTSAKNLERKVSQALTKSAGESQPGRRHSKDERCGGQEAAPADSGRESGKNQLHSDVNRVKNPAVGRQEHFADPDQTSEGFGRNQRDNPPDGKQGAVHLHRVESNRDNNGVNSRISEQGLQRNPHPSGGDQHGTRHPDEKSGSRHGGNSSGNSRDGEFVPGYPQNPYDRQGHPPVGYEGPTSRHDYSSDPHDRPSSRQGYTDYPYARPSSRQGYPEDPYGRPRSRQGHADELYNRPGSRQGYPERDRPRSRPACSEEYRPSSRPDYPDDHRPRSRQGHPPDDRPTSRQGYAEDQYNRPRSSHQDYPTDQYDQKRSRGGYPPEYYDRPRSRQGYPNAYPDDPRGKSNNIQDHEKLRQQGNYDRPRSRQEYAIADGDRRGYPDRYQDDSRSRRGYRDDNDYKVQRGYSDESYERPRSRQKDSENSNMSYDDFERSYYQSRNGSDRTGSEYGRRSRTDRERYDYEEYYREYYNRYMQYVYQQQGGYQQYYPYQYPNRYDKGYLEEMAHYGQIPLDDPRYAYGEAGKAQPGSHHDSTRGSSPAQLSSAADNFARGSRPGSSFSGAEPSSLAADPGYSLDPYGQPYGYPDQISYQEPARHRMTPMKFIVPHTRASFGPAGQLVHVLPNSPADGQPGVVELIDVGSLLSGSLEMEELKRFPGPLIRHETHKNDVLLCCQKMALECRSSLHLVDRESAELIWRYLELLIKQNGTIIGTDVADLLLEGHEPMSSAYEKTDLHIACSRDGLDIDEDESSSSVVDRSVINKSVIEIGVDEATDRFRHLLLHGRKKDALECAMKRNLWGHALFLASKMDSKTHANIMTRFANVSMKMNDPLQTLYQIMSGRQPAAVTLIVDDKWGDWRPHLCIILSNPTQKAELDKKSVVTLGDTLASRGLFFAAQFCYMVGQVPFGHYHKKSSKIVLLGASHSSPFEEFVTNFAVQCTETYEYGLSLATPNLILQVFQVYKFIYMLRLIDYGFLEEALKYAEVLSGIIVQSPSVYSPALAKALYNTSYGLRQCDPQTLLMDETEEVAWFQQLHEVVQRIEEGSILYQSGHGTPLGGFSTGASSEVAEILGRTQAGEFGQQSAGYVVGNATSGGVSYPGSQGHWPQSQVEHQQTVWNSTTQSHDQYVYRDQQWVLVANPVDLQQAPLYQTAPSAGEGSGYASDPVYQAMPTSVGDQTDGSTSHAASEAVGHFSEPPTNLKPGSLRYDSFAIPESTSVTSFPSSGSGFPARHRTSSSSSSHSQQPMSSRRTSVSTVHGLTPPATPGHQISGSSAPLGAAPLGPKKQWWPGEEPDENENSNSSRRIDKHMTKNKGGNKSAGWLGGFFNRISRPKEMILPDDKNPKIVWDKEKNRWVNTDEDPNEVDRSAQPAAPPKDFEVTQKMSTPTMPAPSPNEFSGNKFSRQKIRGARGQYVDVLGGSTKPSPVAPNNLLNLLPKSASMPPNVFIPNARASEEEEEMAAVQEPHAEPAASKNPRPSAANQDPMVKQPTPGSAMDPPTVPLQPLGSASESVNPVEGMPPSMQMFNPSQFSGSLSATPSMPAPSSNSHLKYGQRRIYPK